MLPREEYDDMLATMVDCPYCKAVKRRNCVDPYGNERRSHKARVEAYYKPYRAEQARRNKNIRAIQKSKTKGVPPVKLTFPPKSFLKRVLRQRLVDLIKMRAL